jgi:hypothetical protein
MLQKCLQPVKQLETAVSRPLVKSHSFTSPSRPELQTMKNTENTTGTLTTELGSNEENTHL